MVRRARLPEMLSFSKLRSRIRKFTDQAMCMMMVASVAMSAYVSSDKPRFGSPS